DDREAARIAFGSGEHLGLRNLRWIDAVDVFIDADRTRDHFLAALDGLGVGCRGIGWNGAHLCVLTAHATGSSGLLGTAASTVRRSAGADCAARVGGAARIVRAAGTARAVLPLVVREIRRIALYAGTAPEDRSGDRKFDSSSNRRPTNTGIH